MISNEYIRIMRSDANKDCRKAALSSIGVTKHSRESVLERMSDVCAEVSGRKLGEGKEFFFQ